ncbi:MAG: amino acid permease [Peptoniphilaceae bacterium]|nr:amino acid permease [Peptoniphilaceae bacterium]MDY6085141.1 amino acid permease [Peptoniphilaceae bacterium]
MDQKAKKSVDPKIKWYVLGFMCFSTLWGFGNVVNGFIYFNGVQVIFSWLLMFALYFLPYAFMVGELGSAFKDLGGGVTSWVQETSTKKIAYYAGWTYWAVHITYIASKGSGGLKALSWMIFQNGETYDSLPTLYVQLATLAAFLFFSWITSRGLNPLKKLATLAGSSMFVMSILYIVMMFAAPAINPGASFVNIDWSLSNLIPTIDLKYLTNLSILVFAVGGIEKISPYVNKMDKNPAREFPKAMFFAAGMVVVCALFGSIAMGMMFDPALINASSESFDSYLSNGAYWAFQRLGEYYGVGNLFMIIYAACNMVGQFSTLVVSIDAPLRMLLEDPDASSFIPRALQKKNKYGAYINGIKMVVALSGTIILVQIAVPGAAAVLRQLTKLNSIMMPLRYLWVFFAYMMLRKATDKFTREYKFLKNNGVALFFGGWCFFVTLACCLLGMVSDDPFQLALNIITPLVLLGLGLILPMIRRKEDERLAAQGTATK